MTLSQEIRRDYYFGIDKSWNDNSKYNFSLKESHWDYIIDLRQITPNPNNQQTSVW